MSDKLKDAYLDVAERSVDAAKAAQARNIQEKVCFLSYHALESLGGALSASRRQPYALNHVRKLNQFITLSRGRRYAPTVAYLTTALASLRNRSLYPQIRPNGDVLWPRDTISATNAAKLLSRVSGLRRSMQRDLK